ncbi:MAG: hypothetical protein QXK29_05420 [Candidatus Bathyarchaeia archaeon]
MKGLDNRSETTKVVFKFGGKSLSEGGQARQLAEKVSLELQTGKQPVIVVSAIGNTTDALIEYCCKACSENISRKDLDEILAMGERTSARLFTTVLKAQGVNAKFLDPSDSDWPIITDDCFGDANPIEEKCLPRIRSKLERLFKEHVVPVIPGFIGKTLRGEITTLGRGGSDTTAFLVAKAIGASEVVIVTDVAGVLSADPKVVPDPKIIEEIDVEKLANLCDVGAKFIHTKSLKFLDGSFKVRITSYKCRELSKGGTVVQGSSPKSSASEGNVPITCITMVAEKSSKIWDDIPRVLEVIKRNGISILTLSADASSLKLYVQDVDAEKAAGVLHSELVYNGRSGFLALALKRGIDKLRKR